jgi:hypothetical protein
MFQDIKNSHEYFEHDSTKIILNIDKIIVSQCCCVIYTINKIHETSNII